MLLLLTLSSLLLLSFIEYEPGSIKASNSSCLPSFVMTSKTTSGLLEEPMYDKFELFELVVMLLSDVRLGMITLSSIDFPFLASCK